LLLLLLLKNRYRCSKTMNDKKRILEKKNISVAFEIH